MLLRANHLTKTFKAGRVTAVEDVSFSVVRGRTLGIVGETGSGKSTLARLVTRLIEPDAGEIWYDGVNVTGLSGKRLLFFRHRIQIIFQEALASLDPRMCVRDILEEPFRIQGRPDQAFLTQRVAALLRTVELPAECGARRPRMLSGGQCRRVAIARALATEPELLVCDEPVASLDVLAQAQVLNLLLKLQQARGLTVIFISHDLRAVRHMSDDILVMKDGQICERGPREAVFNAPQHPYTRQLVSIEQAERDH